VKRALLVMAVLVLAACPKKRDDDATPRPHPTPSVEGPGREWLEGKLPSAAITGTPARGGTLRIRVNVEPAGLTRIHDQQAEGTMHRMTIGTVYETLAELDRSTHPRYDLKPLLAESWAESEDHLTLTVKLRRGVKFHNGAAFSSKDVKAVMDAVMNEKNLTTATRSYFTELDSYSAPDPFTFVVKWKKPYFLANRNFLTSIPVMPAAALEGDFDTLPIHRAPIGTGPFRFESWETGRAITLTRNDEYWGERAWVSKVVFRIVKDETVATQMWERGEFDLMTRIQPAVWRALEEKDEKNAWAWRQYHRINFAENLYGWIGWNEERPFFQDRRVRRALAMLFPWDKVTHNIDMDLEPPVTCPYWIESDSCDPTVQRLPYDPPAALKLLDEAGWKDSNGDGVRDQNGVPFKFTFLSNPYSVKLGKLLPLLQEEYRKAGIALEVEKVEAAAYMKRLRTHDFEVGSLSWGNSDPIKDLYQVFHSSQTEGGSNFVGYKNAEVDALLVDIRTTFDPKARAEKERRVHRLLYDDQVYLFLTNRPALDALSVNVRGIAPSLAWYDLRRAYFVHPPGTERGDAGAP
jgi:peptide/nickel transport system substrate-binding protein